MARGRILVIAGSDSSGGAGLEADQKVIAAHGCYAMTATTALTAQNTMGVFDIHHTPPEFVGKLIGLCVSDVGVDVVKTGLFFLLLTYSQYILVFGGCMLASAETIRVIAVELEKFDVKTLVVDPVMVSTSGSHLLPESAVRHLIDLLLPKATIVTPNIPEAKLILSQAGMSTSGSQGVGEMVEIAKLVQSLGPKYVLVKGGHLPLRKDGTVARNEEEKEVVVDVLFGEGQVTMIESPYLRSRNTHGTGCSLASAIASNLANGMEMVRAVKSACRYVEAGIRTSVEMGKGNGPINHFHSVYSLPFAPGRFIEYLLERSDVQKAWKEHTEHDFVAGMADGTLPIESFKYYLIQDYLYLIQFARANALAGYKAKTMEDIGAAAKIVTHIHHEMALHVGYCEGFGISKEEMEATEESQACTAYTRYVLDIGQSEDWLALQVSMAPCLIGYGQIAQRLHADTKTKREGNVYWKWIQNYVADDYSEAVRIGSDLLERHLVLQSPSRVEELVKIFVHATKMETGFWDMGSSLR
ncbi:hypothetical protein HYFRA_00011229 [Hymenoscyphus fraxineus]|uniref:Uncharacterized protein n=1 Tax=Hymenoscyphus fraxineus TaxID=746836 RepID=A0A9N9L0A3_9HELO|nr:hypothetical protein HYFRA_00011229 [Hymenoscyphus fraxineus]